MPRSTSRVPSSAHRRRGAESLPTTVAGIARFRSCREAIGRTNARPRWWYEEPTGLGLAGCDGAATLAVSGSIRHAAWHSPGFRVDVVGRPRRRVRWHGARGSPSIEFTTVPRAASGGAERLAQAAGRVTGARPGNRVVLYAKSGVWWVQPLVAEPFTTIEADSTWQNSIHLGTEYAALLVDRDFRPPATADTLPKRGGSVLAVATVKGAGEYGPRPSKVLTFSGYDWDVRQTPSDRGGSNDYDPANAWTDGDGFLHLRLAMRDDRWTSAEVILTRALGYGTYVFTVRDTSSLDPAAAFGMLTWDDQGADQNHQGARHRDQSVGRSQHPKWPVRASAVLCACQRRSLLGAARHTDPFVPLGARACVVQDNAWKERGRRRRRRAARVHVGCPDARNRAGADEPVLLPLRTPASGEGCRGCR